MKNTIKTTLLAVSILASASVNADGYFLDGMQRYAKSGEMSSRFSGERKWKCQSYESCADKVNNDSTPAVIYSDTARLKKYLKKIKNRLLDSGTLYQVQGRGFNVTVSYVTTDRDTDVAILGVHSNKKVKYQGKDAQIEHILCDELENALNRKIYGW